MSRSGYSDGECDSQEAFWGWIRHRGAVESALRGKRGQAFLKEMLAAMDAMPEKKLIAEELVTEQGEVCAIGSVMKARGIDASGIDLYNYDHIAQIIGIAPSMVREIEYTNDEAWYYKSNMTDEKRFKLVRDWIVSQIAQG